MDRQQDRFDGKALASLSRLTGKELDQDEAREIAENLLGFFGVLSQWNDSLETNRDAEAPRQTGLQADVKESKLDGTEQHPRSHEKRINGISRRSSVLYARVSSKDQEREGFSIPAQQGLLRDYATKNAITVEREFVDVETAKRAGRTGFGEMIAFLKRNKDCRSILVEKTDRLYRNLKDWVTIDELNLEVHLVKEGHVLSADSLSAEKFMHGIKVLVAKNYVDNLSEETRKGMIEKARQGIWPSFAPLGYKNVERADKKRIIVPDETLIPVVNRLFELCRTARYSLKEMGVMLRKEGLTGRWRNGMPTSTVQKILRNRIYIGEFDWDGKQYAGIHEPIISRDVWEAAQRALDLRLAKRAKKAEHAFPFSGLLSCGHCGCALVGDIKKERYIYYRCSGGRGKCPEPYVRQEVLEQEFGHVLKQITIDEEVAAWVTKALRESHADERRSRQEAETRLHRDLHRIQNKLDMLYEGRLEGRITLDYYDRKSQEMRGEQTRLHRGLEGLRTANESYVEAGVRILELSRNMHRLFAIQAAGEKRKLLDFVLTGCSWKNGDLTPTWKQPFDMLALSNCATSSKHEANVPPAVPNENWLPNKSTSKSGTERT